MKYALQLLKDGDTIQGNGGFYWAGVHSGSLALNLEESPQEEMREVMIFFLKRCICFCFMFTGVLFAC